MKSFYPAASWLAAFLLLLTSPGTVQAQAPVITSVMPMANATGAARTSAVAVSFSQPLTATSASALKVFSSQRGGLRTLGTPATVSGNTLSFAPGAFPFMPGETVRYTVTTAAGSAGGALSRARTGRFTVGAGSSGRGYFFPGSTLAVGGSFPIGLATGDVDGDGDLDFVTVNNGSNTISVRLNNGSGTFGGTQTVYAGSSPREVVLGDVDGDGDLDLLVNNYYSHNISVRLNNGSGIFSGTQDVMVGNYPSTIELGDVDGDGDLDLLTTTGSGSSGIAEVCVRTNNGQGLFSGTQNVRTTSSGGPLAVEDFDGDGDLDFLALNGSGVVSMSFNNGSGIFGTPQPQTIGSGLSLNSITAGDVDADGDLDALFSNYSSGTVSVRLNNGSGTLSGTQDVAVGPNPRGVALADIDGDGDLDLLAVNSHELTTPPGTVSIRINDGNGIFSGTQNVSIGNSPGTIATGDLDGDGDLDFLTANAGSSNVSVYLNGLTGLSAVSARPPGGISLFPSPSEGLATLTGAAPYAAVTVFDALGRVAFSTTADATGKAMLTLPGQVPAGMYVVRSGSSAARLIVK